MGTKLSHNCKVDGGGIKKKIQFSEVIKKVNEVYLP